MTKQVLLTAVLTVAIAVQALAQRGNPATAKPDSEFTIHNAHEAWCNGFTIQGSEVYGNRLTPVSKLNTCTGDIWELLPLGPQGEVA